MTNKKKIIFLIVTLLILSVVVSCGQKINKNSSEETKEWLFLLDQEIIKKKKRLRNLEEKVKKAAEDGQNYEQLRQQVEVLKKEMFINDDNLVDLGALFESRGHPRVFQSIDFSTNGYISLSVGVGYKVRKGVGVFSMVFLDGFSFINCDIVGMDFSGSKINNLNIVNSKISESNFRVSKIENIVIENSSITDSDFSFSSMNGYVKDSKSLFNHFYKWSTSGLTFENTYLEKSVFIKSDLSKLNILKNQDNEKKFFQKVVMDNFTKNSLAQNTLLNIEFNKELPQVGIVWNQKNLGHTAYKVYNQIKNFDAIPIRIDYFLEEELIFESKINGEFKEIMKQVVGQRKEDRDEFNRSIAQQYLINSMKGEFSEHKKIRKYIEDFSVNIDALIIPGGLDVIPDFYILDYQSIHDDLKEKIHTEKNPIREYIELLLISDSSKMQKPILGICRGAHILNVYFGGTLYRDLSIYNKGNAVSGRLNDYIFHNIEDENNIFNKIYEGFEKELSAYVNHHQGIKDVAPLFNVAITRKIGALEVPYALYSEIRNSSIWLTQFHPEVETNTEIGTLTEANHQLFNRFFERTKIKISQLVPASQRD